MADAPSRGAALVDDRDEVTRYLEELPDHERAAVELRFLHDLDYREVAHVLRVSEGACRQRVSLALAKLKKRFGQGAATLVAALPLPTVPQGPVLVKSALATSSPVLLKVGGGILVATATSKVAIVALAVGAGIAGTLGVQAALGPAPRLDQRPAPDVAASRLLAERDREIADLREQLAEAGRDRSRGDAPQASEEEARDEAAAESAGFTDYKALGDRWRKAILQIADPEKQTAAWREVREALKSEDPSKVCAALWTVQTTSHYPALDRNGLSGEIITHLSGSTPVVGLEAWLALVALDRVAIVTGRSRVLDSALRERLRQDTLASPFVTRASMLWAMITANDGEVEGLAAEAVLDLLAESELRGETIRGLGAAGSLSDPVAKRLLDLAEESPILGSAAMRFVLARLPNKNRAIVEYLVRKAEGGDTGALRALQRGVRSEDASYVGEHLRSLFDLAESPGVRSQIVVTIGHSGDLSSRGWLVRIAEDEQADSGLRFAAKVAVRSLDRCER